MVSSDMKADVIQPDEANRDRATRMKTPAVKKRKAAAKDDSPVGQVLRNVYQRTVDEAIPTEMLDLLSKLD